MDMEEMTRCVWPRNGCAIQDIDWRQRLHVALGRHLGRDVTLHDLSYHTQTEEDQTHVTTVSIHIDDLAYVFHGAAQDSHRMAIRCAAWVSLMHLQSMGTLPRHV